MTYLKEELTFTVPLTSEAEHLGNKYGNQQSNSQIASKIYHNILAIYAAIFYFKSLGIHTNWSHSDSSDVLNQTLLEVADLELTNFGKIECIPVSAGAEFCYVSPESWSNRIGYLVVEIDQGRRQAKIIKFASILSDDYIGTKIPLSQFQSLDNLFAHLEKLELAQNQINLQTLWQNVGQVVEVGWHTLETFCNNPDFAGLQWANAVRFRPNVTKKAKTDLTIVKPINIGETGEYVIALVLNAKKLLNNTQEVWLTAYSLRNKTYLPPKLQVIVLDEQGEVYLETQASDKEPWIELRFQGETGEQFSLQVALEDSSFEEHFII